MSTSFPKFITKKVLPPQTSTNKSAPSPEFPKKNVLFLKGSLVKFSILLKHCQVWKSLQEQFCFLQ
jgi:hypothetical protein